ncbi:MAG: pilus assembly protein PilM [Patescibacteria group bacterium]
MGLFGRKFETYIGVDIGSHGMKLVELRKNKGRPQLWTYGMVNEDLDIHVALSPEKNVNELLPRGVAPLGTNKIETMDAARALALYSDQKRIDQYAKVLSYLMKKAKVHGRRAASSLPVSQVFHTIINLPKVDQKEIEGLVHSEVAKMLTLPIEEMQIVYQPVPMSEENRSKYIRLLVTAAPKSLVSFYTAIFQKAGLQLSELETEAFALSRSLVGHDQVVSMVLDMGAERTNFFIIDQGLPMTHRSLIIGGNNFDEILGKTTGLPFESIPQAKKDLAFLPDDAIASDNFVNLLDPIVKEIQYNLDLYLHQSGNEYKHPEKIILTGGAVMFPPIIRYLKDRFPMRVFIGNPWARVVCQDSLKKIITDLGPAMSVSIGLALRNF